MEIILEIIICYFLILLRNKTETFYFRRADFLTKGRMSLRDRQPESL
jgi:hypothetical protein